MYSAVQLGPHLDGNVQEKLFVKYFVKLKQPERFFEGNEEWNIFPFVNFISAQLGSLSMPCLCREPFLHLPGLERAFS